MNITQKAYELITKYAYKLAYNKNDYEDIAQIACELLVMNPPAPGLLSKSFYFTVVKRARSRFYFNQNIGGLKNKDVILNEKELDEDEVILRHPDEFDLENVFFLKQKLAGVKALVNNIASPTEAKVFNLFIKDEYEGEQRQHLSNLFKKIRQNY